MIFVPFPKEAIRHPAASTSDGFDRGSEILYLIYKYKLFIELIDLIIADNLLSHTGNHPEISGDATCMEVMKPARRRVALPVSSSRAGEILGSLK